MSLQHRAPHPVPSSGPSPSRDPAAIDTAPAFELHVEGFETDDRLRMQLLVELRSGVARLSVPLHRVVLDVVAMRPGQPGGGPLQCRVTVTLRNRLSLVAYAIDRDAARGATRAMERLHTKMSDAARGGP